MLWVSPTPAALNGSSDSMWPVLVSSRWIAAKPLFCDQTLPSTCDCSARTMLIWVWSFCISAGMLQVVNFLSLMSKLGDGALVHHADPHVALVVGTQAEHAGGP